MKSRFLFFLLLGFSLLGSGPSPAVEISEDALISRVKELTSGRYAGRGSGTPEGEAAAELLSQWFEQNGLQPVFGGDFVQHFPLKGEGWTGDELTGKFSCNVGGILPGAGELSQRFVVLGAHHDHLGRLDPALAGQGPAENGTFYAGANDNASGLTVLFELIRLLKTDDSPSRRSIMFVCFGAEEVGLQGSGFLVSHMPLSMDLVDVMINFDTVGQMVDRRLYVSGVGTSDSLTGFATAANTQGLDLSLARGGWSGSDHMSFNTREVPVLFVFGGPYKEYNTVDDLWPTLNTAGMMEITEYSHRLIQDLRSHPGDFPWIMVAEKLPDNVGQAQNKDTWFGSMPDFTEDVQGYKLAGVFDGSPAAKGGLKKGDVLVKLAGRDVVDLASFTTALRANTPGELVEVVVLREGNRLNFTVVLGDRKDRR
jgi:Peptidase family M28/PDZ domain